MNFVTVKSVEQQDIQAVHRVRERLAQQRKVLINQVRGDLAIDEPLCRLENEHGGRT